MKWHLPRELSPRPTVTVVMPCYNYGRFLPDAVASALDQPGVEVDVVIVDDASTDGSELVAKELERDHPEVRAIINEVNRRHIATYNLGLAEATGDYVVLLSADDLLASGALTRACALMECHPNVGLVYGYAPSFGSSAPLPEAAARTWSTWSGEDWLRRLCRRGDNIIVNPEAVMRRSLMCDIGGYSDAFPHAADMLVWMQAASRMDVGRVNGVQAHYREHGANMHRTDYAGTITDMRERLELFANFFLGTAGGADRSDGGVLLRSARRSIAVEATWCACIAMDDGGSIGGSGPTEFAALAIDAFPEIRATRLYREYERRLVAPVSGPRVQAMATAYDLRWRLRWRRWRRWGT